MIILYIIGSVIVLSMAGSMLFTTFYKVRFYYLFYQTKAYEYLNKYMCSEKFSTESSYKPKSLSIKQVQIGKVEYDSLFNPTIISLILFLQKKDSTYGLFSFLLTRQEKNVWEVKFITELDPTDIKSL